MSLLAVIVASFLLLVIVVTLFYFLLRSYSDLRSFLGGAPFVGVPLKVARQALCLAKLGPTDVFYDLGSGDGRVLRLALEEFGVRKAIGYEISWWPFLRSKQKTRGKKQIKKRLRVYHQNLLQASLSEATVVFLYLYPELLVKLKPKLKSELPANARVVVVSWGFGHPFGQPVACKTILWQPQDFEVFVFDKSGLN